MYENLIQDIAGHLTPPVKRDRIRSTGETGETGGPLMATLVPEFVEPALFPTKGNASH